MTGTNVSGIILEGIAGTGKSSVLRSLLASENWTNKKFFSSVVLSEHQTMRVLESKPKETLSVADCLQLLDQHVSYLEKLNAYLTNTDWLARDRYAQKIPFILERFHLSHLYHYANLKWSDVEEIDSRLTALNSTVYLFTIDPKDMQERIIEDYEKSGWKPYLETLGKNDHVIRQHFIRKQEELVLLAEKSDLPIVRINSSKLSTQEISRIILDRWNFLL